ncbi:hypothetical protein P3S67_010675 [Capsicum chacoense]
MASFSRCKALFGKHCDNNECEAQGGGDEGMVPVRAICRLVKLSISDAKLQDDEFVKKVRKIVDVWENDFVKIATNMKMLGLTGDVPLCTLAKAKVKTESAIAPASSSAPIVTEGLVEIENTDGTTANTTDGTTTNTVDVTTTNPPKTLMSKF